VWSLTFSVSYNVSRGVSLFQMVISDAIVIRPDVAKKLFAKCCNLHGRRESDALLTFTAYTVVSCCTECSLVFDALCGVCTAYVEFALIVL